MLFCHRGALTPRSSGFSMQPCGEAFASCCRCLLHTQQTKPDTPRGSCRRPPGVGPFSQSSGGWSWVVSHHGHFLGVYGKHCEIASAFHSAIAFARAALSLCFNERAFDIRRAWLIFLEASPACTLAAAKAGN